MLLDFVQFCGDRSQSLVASLVPRHDKTCLRDLDQVRLKPVCSTTGTSSSLEILGLASIGSILSKQRTANALICAFVVRIWQNRFSRYIAHLCFVCSLFLLAPDDGCDVFCATLCRHFDFFLRNNYRKVTDLTEDLRYVFESQKKIQLKRW